MDSVIQDSSCLVYTDALENESAAMSIGFFSRARAYFAAHGIMRLV